MGVRGRCSLPPSPCPPSRALNSANCRSKDGRAVGRADGGPLRCSCCEGLSSRSLAHPLNVLSLTHSLGLSLYFSLYAAGERTRHSPFSHRENDGFTFGTIRDSHETISSVVLAKKGRRLSKYSFQCLGDAALRILLENTWHLWYI